MNFSGHIYGVALNDLQQRDALAQAFEAKPYQAPPLAPVVYMKPRSSLACTTIVMPPVGPLAAAASLAVLVARDASRVSEGEALDCIGAVCLAVDLSLPQESYYRPAIAQKNGDGRLLLGEMTAPLMPDEIVTIIDGRVAHGWRLDRLVRPVPRLIADLSDFMTLRAGDVLLVGLPGDCPHILGGRHLRVTAGGLPTVEARFVENGR